MNMLNFVLLLLLIGVLTAHSFFNSKIKHQTANFSPDPWLPELYYSFISTIIVSINWIAHLIYKIRYIWRDMKVSLFKFSTHICSFFLPSPPHQIGTFKSLKYFFTEENASYSYKTNVRSKNHLIFLSILIILSPNQIKMDCSSRFSFHNHNCILTPSSQLKCWGNGLNGRLGYGDTNTRGTGVSSMGDNLPFVNLAGSVIAVESGENTNCVLLTSLEVKCWGDGGLATLGYGDNQDRGDEANEMGEYLPTVYFGSSVTVIDISQGHSHTILLTDQQTIKAWGYGNYGQLGYGDMNNRGDEANEMVNYLPFVQLGSGRTVVQIMTARQSSCVLLDNLSMKCWGRALDGYIGQGNLIDLGDAPNEMSDYLPPINLPSGVVLSTIIPSGFYTNGIISSTGSLFTWGLNNFGGLGLGHANNIGDSGSEMGEYLQSVNVGSGRSVVEGSCGHMHTCAILDNLQLKCWGNSGQGQLGYGDQINRGNGPNEMGDYLPEVNLGSGLIAQSLHLGKDHTCVVLNDNSFKCFGDNGFGQLGIESNFDQGDGSNEMGDYLNPINLGTGIEIQECFDYSPTFSPSLFPTYDPTLELVSCTSSCSHWDHNCILTPSSQIKCWGLGGNGRLGYGDTSNRGDSSNQMSDYLPFVNVNSNVQSIHAGAQHNCVHLSPSFDVRCWGYGLFGQLGYGDTLDRGDGANEMGEYLSTINFGSVFLFLKFHLEVITTSSSQIQVKSKLGEGMIMVN